MKHATRTITAIAITINGRINYISGQSENQWGKFIPQYNTDAFLAKEFVNHADAENYLKRVHNHVHRQFTIVVINILDLPDTSEALRKYDRQTEKTLS